MTGRENLRRGKSREKKRKTEFLNLNWKLDKLIWKRYNSNFFIQICILNVKARKWRNPTEDNLSAMCFHKTKSRWFSFWGLGINVISTCWIWLDPIIQMFAANASCSVESADKFNLWRFVSVKPHQKVLMNFSQRMAGKSSENLERMISRNPKKFVNVFSNFFFNNG